MPFREIRDPETGELVVKYDPEREIIQYRTRAGKFKIAPLERPEEAVKSAEGERVARRE